MGQMKISNQRYKMPSVMPSMGAAMPAMGMMGNSGKGKNLSKARNRALNHKSGWFKDIK